MSARHAWSRVAAAFLGGYVFVWGLISLGIALAVALGMPYEDARALLSFVAFLVFVGCFAWAFTVRTATRAWLTLAGGGAVMTLCGWALANTLL